MQFLNQKLIQENGIWYSKTNKVVSYPSKGNQDSFEIENKSFWFKHRNACILALVNRFAPKQVFYDIGGGNGYVSLHLQNNGIETVLLEPGPDGAKNAFSRGLKNVICSTLEEAGFVDESIDSVGLFDVVEHIENDLNFMKIIAQKQKKGAYAFITVPAYRLLWSNEDNDAGHFRRYTISSMEKLLKNAGLTPVFSTYIFCFLPLPILLFRALPSLLGFNKNSTDLQKHKQEHLNKGMMSKFLDRLLDWELKRVSKGNNIMFGGSVFMVARKSKA